MHAAQNSARNPTFAGQYSFWSLSCRINGPAQDCSNRITSLGIWVDRNVVHCASFALWVEKRHDPYLKFAEICQQFHRNTVFDVQLLNKSSRPKLWPFKHCVEYMA